MITQRRSRRSGNRGMTRVGAVFTILLSLAVATGIGALLGYYFPGISFIRRVQEVYEPPFGGKTIVRILVLGEDNTGGTKSKPRGLSDTIMLVSIDTSTNRIAALSIPRDTRVDLDGYGGQCKINASHVFGGPTLTEMAVEQLVGIKADYYIKTNVEGFKRSVDILGGVEMDVEKDMRYRDRRGGLYINLRKGPQLLDGEKAMQYVRFRHDVMGDITRIQRQQKFLKALAQKALSPVNLPKLPRIIRTIRSNVKTDLTLRDMLELAKLSRKADINQVRMETLPGVPQNIGGASYWICDPGQTAQVVQDLFFTPASVGTGS